MSPRIAIIGPRSATAQHALYLGMEGAEVVGVSPEDLEHEPTVPAFDSPQRMLERLRPDGVVVLSDGATRSRYIAAGLRTGCHVLCASPLIYDEKLSPFECLETATRLCRRSRELDLDLCAIAPYVSLVPALRELAHLGLGPTRGVWSFAMRILRSPIDGRTDPRSWLAEEGSHPLGLLLGLVPGARMREENAQVAVEPDACRIAFDCHAPSSIAGDAPHQCAVSIVLGEAEKPLVEVEVNGLRIACIERAATDGTHPCYLRVGEHEESCGDPAQATIRSFLARIRRDDAGPIADAEQALTSLRMLLRLLRLGSGSTAVPAPGGALGK
ncbi:MAG: hypothetical protein GF320_20620 [Armatimonadia bacterium]|nr:hypothetical protein [Armatimonadia bacterium]